MKYEECRLPPRTNKFTPGSLKVGDIIEALIKQDDEKVFGWQKARIKELKVSSTEYLGKTSFMCMQGIHFSDTLFFLRW